MLQPFVKVAISLIADLTEVECFNMPFVVEGTPCFFIREINPVVKSRDTVLEFTCACSSPEMTENETAASNI
jgi:hypothetical protein